MFDKASLKLGLDKAVLQSMNTTQGGKDYGGSGKQPLSKKEIEDLLKKGAYGALMEDDNAGDKFCEEDIDQILMRRTQIITLESEKGSQFSKATFASNSDRTDIDIDDPDFWKKWAKRAEIDTDTILSNGQEELLVLSEPRRRTQIKRYGQVLKVNLSSSFLCLRLHRLCLQDEAVLEGVSELETTSNSDEEPGVPSTRSKVAGRKDRSRRSLRRSRRGNYDEDFAPEEGEVEYGAWTKTECFKVEKGLMTFGYVISHFCEFIFFGLFP
jgi:chromodomain-helicase-DNA-binding protein 7